MLDRLRDRTHSLLLARAEERYLAGTAQLREPELGLLLSRYQDLFELERLSEVQLRLAESAGEEERRLRYLLEYLVRGRGRALAAEEVAALQVWEAFGSVAVGERRIPLREVRGVVGGMADPAERHAVAEAYFDALEDRENLVEELLSRERDVVEEVGAGSYLVTSEVLGRIDLRALALAAERFLGETEALHAELLAWYLPRLAGIPPAEGREVDGWRLAAALPADGALPSPPDAAVRRVLAGTGLDPLAGGRIRVESRPGGGGGAECHALDVPHDVRVVAAPARTAAGQHRLLRAYGCALHLANAEPDLPLEFRWLGDFSVTRGFGLCVAGLLREEPFLSRVLGLGRADARERARLGALLDLQRARRDAAQLALEVDLLDRTAEAGAIRDEYVPRLTRATGLRHDPRGAVWSIRPGFTVARRLRAEQLAPVLATWLRDRFDEDWFRNPAAGPALRTLLASGRRYDASELALQLRSAPLAFDDVRDRASRAAG